MKLVKQSPSLLKSSVIDLFCRQDFTWGTDVTELRNLNAMGIIWSLGDKGQVAAITKGKVGVITIMAGGVKTATKIVWPSQTQGGD